LFCCPARPSSRVLLKLGTPETWLNEAGDLSQELGRDAEAEEAYKESIGVNHDYQETYHAYLQLAALSKRLGRSDEAEKYYDQIAELTSKLLKDTKNRSAAGDGYYRLGIISERRGRDKEALGAVPEGCGASSESRQDASCA